MNAGRKTLYVWDRFGECTMLSRDSKGIAANTGDELPETFHEDCLRGVYVFEGSVLDTQDWTPDQCDKAGIPHDARNYTEWWHGKMRLATTDEILAVMSDPRSAGGGES